MSATNHTDFNKRVSAASLQIATGIVFGDMGTAPLYTYAAVFHEGEIINAIKALGVLSHVFWTLLLLTTIKHIFIVIFAHNKREGGIFSLYALIRRYFGKWLVKPAIIGAAFLIADGIITKFMLSESYLSHDNDIPYWKNMLLKLYYNLKTVAVTEEKNFGLNTSNVLLEKYPFVLSPAGQVMLKRQKD